MEIDFLNDQGVVRFQSTGQGDRQRKRFLAALTVDPISLISLALLLFRLINSLKVTLDFEQNIVICTSVTS